MNGAVDNGDPRRGDVCGRIALAGEAGCCQTTRRAPPCANGGKTCGQTGARGPPSGRLTEYARGRGVENLPCVQGDRSFAPRAAKPGNGNLKKQTPNRGVRA